MSALTLDAILRAEHDALKEAADEWLGISGTDRRASEDLQWVIGVNDFATRLIAILEDNGEAKQR